MELYDAIFYRKSIRNYSKKSIKSSLMEEVKSLCSNITYLNKDLNIKAHVVERGHLIQFLMGKSCEVKAPHYIVITSNEGEHNLENVGFVGEEILLGMTSLGIATCWLQCSLKREDILEFIGLDEIDIDDEKYESKIEKPFAIIAFGYAEKQEALFRSVGSEPDRKRLKKVCKKIDRKWVKILNAVRVAPSIKNIQPWLFYSKEYGFDLYEEKPKKGTLENSKISMGVALKHFDIACKYFNVDAKFEEKEVKRKRGKNYLISIIDNGKL
ncbi:MAG: nitroreductase family protein [Peptostreptococcaceae bacterium]|jgi:nitroreductase|nr:nitroreductase family protein [Peptostreptococcaceae bacterium]